MFYLRWRDQSPVTKNKFKPVVSAARKKGDIKNVAVSVLLAEMFNIVINDHGRTQKSDFSFLDQKYTFWASLVQKSK